MRTIKLQKMRIENFKGIQSITLDFCGENTIISGHNGVGKSTVMDAYSWLLWNKNAAGSTRFEVRPRTKAGYELHEVMTTVEATFFVFEESDNDKKQRFFEFTVRRDEREDLSDGQMAHLNPSDIANKKSFYFIDNVPYTAKVFSDKIKDLLAPEDNLMVLSNPASFFQLKEDKQRELLFRCCGSISDQTIFGWEEVSRICGAVTTPYQAKEALERQIKEYKKKCSEIPARIDSICKLHEVEKDYESLIEAAEKKKENISAQGNAAKLEWELVVKEQDEINSKKPNRDRIIELEERSRNLRREIKFYQEFMETSLFRKAANTCPSCGYVLMDFKEEVENSKNMIEAAEGELKECLELLEKENHKYECALQLYDSKLKEIETENAKRRALIEGLMEGLRKEYTQCMMDIAIYQENKKAAEEVKRLRDELRLIDDEIADAMNKLDILKEWIERKNRNQMNQINEQFHLVQFKLFEMQANGEFNPCCKAMVNGVSYANLNTASKVHVSIELANLFSEFYGVCCPMWVDNKESILDIPPIDTQLICLKVDERYDRLHVEKLKSTTEYKSRRTKEFVEWMEYMEKKHKELHIEAE